MNREEVYIGLRDGDYEIELGENIYLTQGGFDYYPIQLGDEKVLYAIAHDIGDYMNSHIETYGENDNGIIIKEYKLKGEIDGMPVAGVRWFGNEPENASDRVVDLLYSKHNTSNRVTLDLNECDMSNIVFANEMFSGVNRHDMMILFPGDDKRLKPVGCTSMFEEAHIATVMDLGYIDFSDTIEMDKMFSQSGIRSIKFNGDELYENVKNMDECFSGTKISKVDLGMFHMSGDISLDRMFMKCRNIINITLPVMHNCVASASSMFDGCVKLSTVDFKGEWRLVNGNRIMKGCYALGDIDSNAFFHDIDITNMNEALSACTKLAGDGIKLSINDLGLSNVRDETALIRNMLGEAVYKVINLSKVTLSNTLTIKDCQEIPPFRERSNATIIIKKEFLNMKHGDKAKNIECIMLDDTDVDIDDVYAIRARYGASERGVIVIGID